MAAAAFAALAAESITHLELRSAWSWTECSPAYHLLRPYLVYLQVKDARASQALKSLLNELSVSWR